MSIDQKSEPSELRKIVNYWPETSTLTPLIRATVSAIERLQAEVKKLNADFASGKSTLKHYVELRQELTRLQAEVSGLSTKHAKALAWIACVELVVDDLRKVSHPTFEDLTKLRDEVKVLEQGHAVLINRTLNIEQKVWPEGSADPVPPPNPNTPTERPPTGPIMVDISAIEPPAKQEEPFAFLKGADVYLNVGQGDEYIMGGVDSIDDAKYMADHVNSAVAAREKGLRDRIARMISEHTDEVRARDRRIAELEKQLAGANHEISRLRDDVILVEGKRLELKRQLAAANAKCERAGDDQEPINCKYLSCEKDEAMRTEVESASDELIAAIKAKPSSHLTCSVLAALVTRISELKQQLAATNAKCERAGDEAIVKFWDAHAYQVHLHDTLEMGVDVDLHRAKLK